MSAATLCPHEMFEGTRQALHKLSTRHLMLITFGWDKDSALAELDSIGYSYESVRTINFIKRSYMIEAVTGIRRFGYSKKNRISNGVVTVCHLLSQGASDVVIAGVSGRRDSGHAYPSIQTVNIHHENDIEALSILHERGFSVRTTEKELALESGIKLVTSENI